MKLYRDDEVKVLGISFHTFLTLFGCARQEEYLDLRVLLENNTWNGPFPEQILLRLHVLSSLVDLDNFFFLTQFRRLRVMDVLYWVTPEAENSMDHELIARLTWPNSSLADSRLTDVCVRYDMSCRVASCQHLLIILASLMVPACSMTFPEFGATHEFCSEFINKLQVNFSRFNKLEEKPLDMPDQRVLGNIPMMALMRAINNLYKYYLVAVSEYCLDPDHVRETSANSLIQLEWFGRFLPTITARLCCDFFANYYTCVCNWISPQEFVRCMLPTVQSVSAKIHERLLNAQSFQQQQKDGLKLYSIEECAQHITGLGHDTVSSTPTEQMLLTSIRRITVDGFPAVGLELRMKSDTRTSLRLAPYVFREGFPIRNYSHADHLNLFRIFPPRDQLRINAALTTHVDQAERTSFTCPTFPLKYKVRKRKSSYLQDVGYQTTKAPAMFQLGENSLFPTSMLYDQFGFLPMYPVSYLSRSQKSVLPGPSLQFLIKKRQWDMKNPWAFGCGGPQLSFMDITSPPALPAWRIEQSDSESEGSGSSRATKSRRLEDKTDREETRELVNYAAYLEDYNDYMPDEDNEIDHYEEPERIRETNYAFVDFNATLEEFYSEILSWIVDPWDMEREEHINSNHGLNAKWLYKFFQSEKRGKAILDQVTNASTLAEYRAHCRAALVLNTRANVQSTLAEEKFISLKTNPAGWMNNFMDNDLWTNQGEEQRVITMDVSAVNASSKLLHLNGTSTDEELNRQIVDNCLRGLTLCVAQIHRGGRSRLCPIPDNSSRKSEDSSSLIFMLIRRVHLRNFDGEDLGRDLGTAQIHEIDIRLSLDRKTLKDQNFAVHAGHTMSFLPIRTMACELRITRAIERLHHLPPRFVNYMFGSQQIAVNYTAEEVRLQPSNSNLTSGMTSGNLPEGDNAVRARVTAQVDPGCLEYLRNCFHHPDIQVDEPHFNALIQMAKVLGTAEPDSSGHYLLQGPPGTGKTTNILHMIGTIMSHSQYGHSGRFTEQVTHRRTPRNERLRRRSNRQHCLKVLAVASNNQAVDNILEKIHNNGIPDGEGGTIRPKLVRIARHNYDQECPAFVRPYLIHNAARPYEEDETRNNPSLRAKRQYADECILFLATSTSCGSSQLKELRQSFDIVIHDEAANSLELETLIALTAAVTNNGDRRLYYFGVGDDKQLQALTYVPTMIHSSRMTDLTPFDLTNFKQSLFERLIRNHRVMFYFLSSQYRMHPTISRLTSPPFYKCLFHCPLPLENFHVPYNQPWIQNDNAQGQAYYPLTFVDTSSIPTQRRYERTSGRGDYTNILEAQVIVTIITRLIERAGHDLDRQIAVIAPYRSQVALIRTYLNIHCTILGSNLRRNQADITVSTVDSMQGSQRNVVIFSATRSNRRGNVGFVRDPARLDVSLTRARFLNIIIGDMSTLQTSASTSPNVASANLPPANAGATQVQGRTRGIASLEKIYIQCSSHADDYARVASVRIDAETSPHSATFPQLSTPFRPRRQPMTTRSNPQNAAPEPEVITMTPSVWFHTLFPQQ